MPPRAAAKFIEDVGRTDAAALRRAIALLAQLELDTRGGSALDPDTLARADDRADRRLKRDLAGAVRRY